MKWLLLAATLVLGGSGCGTGGGGPHCRVGCRCGRSCISCLDTCRMGIDGTGESMEHPGEIVGPYVGDAGVPEAGQP